MIKINRYLLGITRDGDPQKNNSMIVTHVVAICVLRDRKVILTEESAHSQYVNVIESMIDGTIYGVEDIVETVAKSLMFRDDLRASGGEIIPEYVSTNEAMFRLRAGAQHIVDALSWVSEKAAA